MGLKDRVKQRRELLGLSQKNIGDAVGVRQQTIQQIEDGKIKRSRHIEKIARVLKVTPEWLLFGTGHPEDKTLQSNEIKWRDATTDGDHITKEHTRLKTIYGAGYRPVRLMFYYPNRTQAQRIQRVLQDLYIGLGGGYYYGDAAWSYLREYTGHDLFRIIQQIAIEKTGNAS